MIKEKQNNPNKKRKKTPLGKQMPPEALDPVLTSLDALVISSRRACVLFEFFFFFLPIVRSERQR